MPTNARTHKFYRHLEVSRLREGKPDIDRTDGNIDIHELVLQDCAIMKPAINNKNQFRSAPGQPLPVSSGLGDSFSINTHTVCSVRYHTHAHQVTQSAGPGKVAAFMTPYTTMSHAELVAACEAKDIEIAQIKDELRIALARIAFRDAMWKALHEEEI